MPSNKNGNIEVPPPTTVRAISTVNLSSLPYIFRFPVKIQGLLRDFYHLTHYADGRCRGLWQEIASTLIFCPFEVDSSQAQHLCLLPFTKQTIKVSTLLNPPSSSIFTALPMYIMKHPHHCLW